MASDLEQVIGLLQQMVSTGDGRKNLENLISKLAPGFSANSGSEQMPTASEASEIKNTVPAEVVSDESLASAVASSEDTFPVDGFSGSEQSSTGSSGTNFASAGQIGGLPGILATLGSPDFLNRVQNIFSSMQSNNSQRNNLMNALKPYLSARRQSKFDLAMQIMQLSNLPQFAKFFRR